MACNPCNPCRLSGQVSIFYWIKAKCVDLRISRSMNKYVYQIQGALENAAGEFLGLRVLVCDLYNFESVDVPREVLDKESAAYLEFRLKITKDPVNIQRLPNGVQNKIRQLLGKWLDRWVLENFYGDSGYSEGINS